jgi:D-glycero-D-manno-heptose 1,7-bisphosphate phosphatase
MPLAAIDTVLLDRDGTLIEECHYLCDPDAVRLIPEVPTPMARLCQLGVRFFLVSNQSGIGRGIFREADLVRVQARLTELLAAQGITLAGAAFCPHAPEEGCRCRKPAPGQWEALDQEHGLDPGSTLVVGDKISDVALGRSQGCMTALVRTGHGEAHAKRLGLPPLAGDLMALPAHPQWPDLQASSLAAVLKALLTAREER